METLKKWGWDSLRIVGFMFALTMVIWFAMLFTAFPWIVLGVIFWGFVVWVLYAFFSSL